MARNKYPEETVARILDAAQRLFLEKGYDQTTIQDIVDQLGGLTKGAVYHHFKSKEEILDAVGDRMFLQNNPFEAVRRRTDLNGLQKLREAIRLNQADSAAASVTVQSIPINRNPRILVEMIESNRRILTPYYLELLEEGNRDGSLHTDYPRELAELIPLLTSLAAVGVPRHQGPGPAEVRLPGRYAGPDGGAPGGRRDPPPHRRIFCTHPRRRLRGRARRLVRRAAVFPASARGIFSGTIHSFGMYNTPRQLLPFFFWHYTYLLNV